MRVAAALADAFLKGSAPVGEAAVFAYPPSASSVLSGPMRSGPTAGTRPEFRRAYLHFEVCTSWSGLLQSGGLRLKGLEPDVETRASP